MSVTQQQVLDALKQVESPRGVALPDANVLSAITAGDGKVFFSINVEAAEARAWETTRAQAEAAVRAIPGVTSVTATVTSRVTRFSKSRSRCSSACASNAAVAWRAAYKLPFVSGKVTLTPTAE